MKCYLNTILSVVFILLHFRCAEQAIVPGEGDNDIQLCQEDNLLIESDNTFGCALFRSLVALEGEKNVVVSPLSISMALGMVYNGAETETKEAMEKTLGLEGLTRQEINESYQRVIGYLTALDTKVAFQIANSIWGLEGYPFKQTFFDINRQYFDAEVRILDLYQPDAADAINQWVCGKTNAKITEVISYDEIVSNQIRMLLINAIYFKGIWTYLFDEKNTCDADFHKSDATATPCKMMGQEGEFLYLQNELFQAIELPYGNERFSMVIFVPRSSITLDSLITEFTADNFTQWSAGFTQQEVMVFLPRFKLEYKTELKAVLSSLGMGIAFTPAADFSGIAETGLYISKVIHKTFIEVNEEGTEAAAVTVITVVDSVMPGTYIRADRPFLFVIKEKMSNTILFMGKVVEPK